MPIYEYECQTCGCRHEALQKVSDPLLTDCPECENPGLKKLVSVAGFRLSGSGWYETDFKSDGKRNLATGDSQEKNTKDAKKVNKEAGNKKDSSTAKSSVSSSKKDAKVS